MIDFLLSAIKIIFLLGFLVFIHEGGHFLVAKLCKIKVNEFAIGFGPTIYKKQGKQTKYALRLIPLGGFVNMEGEEQRSEKEGSFSMASIPKRILIVLAGGVVNIIFGLLVYFIISSTSYTYTSNIISKIAPEYENAKVAGVIEGDEVYKINGKRTRSASDIEKQLEKSNGETLSLTIKRENEFIQIIQEPVEIKVKSTGIYLNSETTQVVAVMEDSKAKEKDIRVKDVIVSINNQEVENNTQKLLEVLDKVENNDIITMKIKREEEVIEIEMIPDTISTYYLGVVLKPVEPSFLNSIYYGFWNTNDFAFSIIDNLKMLFTGKVKTDQLMGPVGISDMVSQTKGFTDFIYMLALISLSLGVTNLLPFPPLDGGKIVILLIEGIRRKPLKENIEVGIQMAGFCILIALSIYVTYNDILRIF